MSQNRFGTDLTSQEAPTSGKSMKDMMSPTARECPAHTTGTNTTNQYIAKETPKGRLGARVKQA